MNYKETLEFLINRLPAFHRIGKAAYKNNLDNTIKLDDHLGHPHLKFRTIHVAGTNGKGSVSHMIASVLGEAGYMVGLYTSPHLVDFRERIKINGRMIQEEEVISFVENNRNILSETGFSFFEMTVGMAFDHFARHKVDVAVIEVGLGGRLDSTNIIIPELSVITNIGHDHMDLLGDTLEKVAAEKAGIIKPGIPVVISETQVETMNVFSDYAHKSGSEISFADKLFKCYPGNLNILSGEREYTLVEKLTGKTISGKIPLMGDYQSRNIPAVYLACRKLRNIFAVTDEVVTAGISHVVENTGLHGRWQITGRAPLVICDTGHNREGLQYVVNQLNSIPRKTLRMVIGFVNDKDLSHVLPLLPVDAIYYFTKASVERALDSQLLKSKAEEFGLHGLSYPDVDTAFQMAQSESGPDDIIFIGGSTFVVADYLGR